MLLYARDDFIHLLFSADRKLTFGSIFFVNPDFLGIQIWQKKNCKLQQFEIATKLRKSKKL